jgi:hypothetical protein
VLNLNAPAGSDFATITYSESKAVLTNAMKDLPAIAQSHETGKPHPMVAALSNMEKVGGEARIVLDELVDDPGPASSRSQQRWLPPPWQSGHSLFLRR